MSHKKGWHQVTFFYFMYEYLSALVRTHIHIFSTE